MNIIPCIFNQIVAKIHLWTIVILFIKKTKATNYITIVCIYTDVLDINDLKPDMQLKGTVRNVVDFGCFVDIGVHHDGLLHISEMSDRYIKHPSDLFKTGDVIEVRIKDVDTKKCRISLTRKGMNTSKN